METEFKRRRLTPTAIIIQSVLRIENKNYPEKGKKNNSRMWNIREKIYRKQEPGKGSIWFLAKCKL